MSILPLLFTAALATHPIGGVTYYGYTGTVHIEGAVNSFNYSNGVMLIVMSSPGDGIFKNGFEVGQWQNEIHTQSCTNLKECK